MAGSYRRQIEAIAKRWGFHLHRQGKHLIWKHPNGSIVTTPASTSNWHVLPNAEARMRKAAS
jgi:predicted RNA binding protein YcfA (HicA-like mRNA interferase family)